MKHAEATVPPAPSPAPSPSVAAQAPARDEIYAAITSHTISAAAARFPERVYVPNTLSGTVDEIDPATFKVVSVLHVGGVPHHVTPSWDLQHLYVDNSGNGTLDEINPMTGRLTRTISMPAPYNLYSTPDGKKAVLVAEYDKEIEFRNPRTWKLIKAVPIPWAGVDHMDFSRNGRYLLTSCEYTGEVVRVDTVHMRVTGELAVGGNPVDVKVSPDGKLFFVANQGLGGVSVIDPKRMKQVGFIVTGTGAHGFAVSRNAKMLYVSNRLAGSISVIRFAGRKVVATWQVGGSPDMLQVSPNGRQLWASNRFGDTVSVISTGTGRVIRQITVGSQPHGLAYFPQPGRFSLGHNGVYR